MAKQDGPARKRFGARLSPITSVAPTHLISLAMVGLVLVNVLCVYLAVRTPYLGFRMAPAPEANGIVVARLNPHGPMSASGFKTGDILVMIDSKAAAPIQIDWRLAVPDPNFLETQAEILAVMQLQGKIADHMKAQILEFTLADGTRRTVAPATRRPIAHLFTDDRFVMPMLIGNFAFGIGFIFWVFRRSEPALRLLLWMGIGNAVALWTPAIGWVQEFAVTELERRTIFALNQFAVMGNAFVLLCLLLIYPTKLAPWNVIWLLGAACLALWFNSTFHFVALPTRVLLLYFIALTGLAIIAVVLQYLRTRRKPIERAQASLITLCVLTMTFVVLAVYVLPIMLTGESLGGEIWISALATTLPLLGFGLGITRYRLFDLPTWWFNASLWLLSGFLIVTIELALFFFVGTRHITSLGVATLAVGWVYFPLRQFLFRKFVPSGARRMHEILPGYLESLSQARAGSDFDHCLIDEVTELFAPALVTRPKLIANEVQILERGLTLLMPATDGHPIQLEAADNGRRLFDRRDASLAAVLIDITRRYKTQIEDIERSVTQERIRIARDLHDSVGAKLVTLIHGAPTAEVSQQARDVTGALKDTIWLLRTNEAQSLESAISKWSEEARVRTEEAEISLNWRQDALGDIVMPAQHLVSLGNIMRESVTNVIRHSEATQLTIGVDLLDAGHLRIRLHHDGAKISPARWPRGFGLKGIDERLSELGGSVDWQSDPIERDLVIMSILVPVREE